MNEKHEKACSCDDCDQESDDEPNYDEWRKAFPTLSWEESKDSSEPEKIKD